MAALGRGDDRAEAVAWIPDVVEDTGGSADELRGRGSPKAVARAVTVLTRHAGRDNDDYDDCVAADPLSLIVTCADIADDADPERLAALDAGTRQRLTATYGQALGRLQEPSCSTPSRAARDGEADPHERRSARMQPQELGDRVDPS